MIEVVDCTPTEDCEIYFPNVFSPNLDGTNDTFRALYNCTPETFYLAIYNRWGGLIFETTNPEAVWDGTFEGEKMPIDVYARLARYRLPGATEELLEYGDLTLLR
ncbi:MAG: gliding motility-associated C-terminal domain-containing protein [Phaeodactylibacter sp.]|nr:gliding motility-associated C-terminal domain-containing protein [Phaeodactylibacter sp.]